MIIRTVLAVAALAIGATAVTAQQDPIKARQALMKANGQQAGIGAKMVKGEEPFSLDKAKKVFATYQDVAKAHQLFPESSKTGDTAALPAVWDNKADFDARLAKLVKEINENAPKATSLEGMKQARTAIVQNCNDCHDVYRLKKN